MPLTPVSTGDPHVAAHNEERDSINDLETAVNLKVDKPTVPLVGQVLRYNGTSWDASATRWFEGTGQPEGIIAAPIGSRYVQTDGSQGAIEWIKKTGTATTNTGWILVSADTGWRNISGMINKRTTGEVFSAYLRRNNNLVDFYLDMTMPNNNDSPYGIVTLPSGFRPDFARYGGIQDNREQAAGFTAVFANGEINLYSPITSGKRDRWNGQWLTNDPWPSTLPGSAM